MSANAAMEEAKPRWALYTRESTEAQLDGKEYNSHHSQEDYLRAFVESEGGVVAAVYSDTETGTKLDTRDGLLRLMADAQAGELDHAVAYDIDRWARNIQTYALMKRLTTETGVRFESATQRFRDDAEGELMELQMAGFAQYYSRLVSRKVKIKRHEMLKRGMWPGGPVPYGYRSIDKKLVPHPEDSDVVRLMMDLFIEHPSRAAVRRQLPPDVKTRRGNPWSNTSIEHLLRNRVYLGELKCGDDWVAGNHEAIVDRAVFEKVQALTPTKRRVHHKMERAYPLTGVLVCGVCGSNMTPSYVSRPTKRVPYYRCTSTFRLGWGACSIKQVNADRIERWMTTLIADLAASPALVDDAVSKANHSRVANAEPLREQQADLRDRVRELDRRIDNLVDVLATQGTAALTSIEGKLREAERDKVIVEADLAEVSETLRNLTRANVNEERVRAVLADFRLLYEIATGKERGELIRLLFRRIEFSGPDENIEVELWDRTSQSLEPHSANQSEGGSRLQTIQLRMASAPPNRSASPAESAPESSRGGNGGSRRAPRRAARGERASGGVAGR